MHYMIRFTTSYFNISQEDENPINPIYGQSLLKWLKNQLEGRVEMEKPAPEDWGWYTYTKWNGRKYMVGSCVLENEDNSMEWILQLEKQRSIKEKLLGKEKMTMTDECLLFFKSIIESESEFKDIVVEMA